MTDSASHVAVLIAHPSAPAVDDALIAAARAALPAPGAIRHLNPGIAAEIGCSGGADIAAIRAALADAPVDVALLPAQGRRKSLFLADMDSTMIGQECIDELADHAGMKAHVAAITERAMRGEIAFEPALRERVALLKGLPLAVVDTVIAERIRLTPGGTALVRTMKAHGARTLLVSGGFTLFTRQVAAMIGFDAHRANVLVADAGSFAGLVEEPILGREAKLAALIEWRTALGLAADDTLAVGDGANDLAMIGEAGLGVAYHAKPAVAAAAQVRIDHGDLTALLYLQGYAADEFVDA
ncbi:phosphoserine phosphatase SerB [Ancylobacter dichloromethanicus]|uniref:Phosphoserine phosphatase n=1 Tax=Ancylobacter dichloromethanicus TaxID=518825 RepID=A0A9W6J3Y0_9HYPH|nr:phosphoserine phosphatase SerB [Ancylobacter dichloromethanicus]MBS7555245.1 phosphoserine phosphatase SerB [Ancylobacter dichloromethanicus]GLK70425.1 phosphoserine phosphatase SerB [Ancylobacter dichloromethanicus]